MTTFRVIDFESLVRDLLAGRRQWDDVHNFVIESEWKGETDFPPGTPDALKDLHAAFFADSKDDPQFLVSKDEIRKLLIVVPFALAAEEEKMILEQEREQGMLGQAGQGVSRNAF